MNRLRNKRLIIGLGTGRCGTVTLQKILNQYNADVTHEHRQMPWQFNRNALLNNFNSLGKRFQPIVGDVGFWWINYVDAIRQYDVKFVCLKRDKDQTVDSFLGRFEYEDYWTENCFPREIDGKPTLTEAFPQWQTKDKKEAVSRYYDLYYKIAVEHAKQDDFKIFHMNDVLNNGEVQQKMLDWLDLPKHRVLTGHRYNPREDVWKYENLLSEDHPVKYGIKRTENQVL